MKPKYATACLRRAGGGAVEEAQGIYPVLGNLFGTTRSVALAMAQKQARSARQRCADIGK